MKQFKLILFVITGLALVGFFWQISDNRSRLNSLIEEVKSADSLAQPTQEKLQAVENFSKSHMFASSSVILAEQYKRDMQSSKNAPSQDIYAEAQAACASHSDSVTLARCVSNYLASRSSVDSSKQATPAPKIQDYTYGFRSPLLAADLAGIFLLTALITGGAALLVKD